MNMLAAARVASFADLYDEAMRLVETHEVANAAIMESTRKLFGPSPLKSAASRLNHSARGPKRHLGQHPRID
jgi:hypothetical protein